MVSTAQLGAPGRRVPAMSWVALAALLGLAVFPWLLAGPGSDFWTMLVARGLIYAMAAMALQLILGRAGLVSFGFAAFLGLGAYAVAIPYAHGLEEGLVVLPLAALVGAVFAFATGAIVLRTRGIAFIMISLAFAQMVYFAGTSLAAYGGDDGMTLWSRSTIAGLPLLDDDRTFYYLCLLCCAATWFLLRGIAISPVGRVLDGIRQNEPRMRALGYDPNRYLLLAYTISGAIAGLAGGLAANQTEYVSPAIMTWHRSGELIVMVVVGGVHSLTGAAIGALGLVLLEDALAGWTEHWRLVLGLLLLALVLRSRNGIASLLDRRRGR